MSIVKYNENPNPEDDMSTKYYQLKKKKKQIDTKRNELINQVTYIKKQQQQLQFKLLKASQTLQYANNVHEKHLFAIDEKIKRYQQKKKSLEQLKSQNNKKRSQLHQNIKNKTKQKREQNRQKAIELKSQLQQKKKKHIEKMNRIFCKNYSRFKQTQSEREHTRESVFRTQRKKHEFVKSSYQSMFNLQSQQVKEHQQEICSLSLEIEKYKSRVEKKKFRLNSLERQISEFQKPPTLKYKKYSLNQSRMLSQKASDIVLSGVFFLTKMN